MDPLHSHRFLPLPVLLGPARGSPGKSPARSLSLFFMPCSLLIHPTSPVKGSWVPLDLGIPWFQVLLRLIGAHGLVGGWGPIPMIPWTPACLAPKGPAVPVSYPQVVTGFWLVLPVLLVPFRGSPGSSLAQSLSLFFMPANPLLGQPSSLVEGPSAPQVPGSPRILVLLLLIGVQGMGA